MLPPQSPQEIGMSKNNTLSEILKILEEFNGPVSAIEIINRIGSRNKTTVYRQLNKLVETKVLRLIVSTVEAKTYYELSSDLHSHFECVNCGLINCLKNFSAPEIKSGRIFSSKFDGLCNSCNG